MQREGWQIIEQRYDDLGYSSETLDRPASNRLVEDIRVGKIDRVLVHYLDRVARKILIACQFLELLWQPDVAITIIASRRLPAMRMVSCSSISWQRLPSSSRK